MNIQANNWQLFPTPPSSQDSDEPGIRLAEMMREARDTHRDHYERPIEAYPRVAPADIEAAVPEPVPVAVVSQATPARTWPRTVAVSIVLLTTAAVGTLVSSLFNTLFNKKINDKMG